MKKILSITAILIVIICCLTGCMSQNPFETEQTNELGQIIGAETTQAEVSPINHISATLISYEINKFKDMNFADYKQSISEPSEKGTAITLLLSSASTEMPVSNIEKVVIKNANGTAMNMSTKTFLTNKADCCVVFTKTEGIHELSKFVIEITTYNGEELLIPMPNALNPEKAQQYVIPAGMATHGDLIDINGNIYFILQTGELGFVASNDNNKTIAETVVGTILIPLANTFTPRISANDFGTQFFDNDNKGDYKTNVKLSINDKELMEIYGDNARGLYAEMITITFTLAGGEGIIAEEVIENEMYVVKNTWLKGMFAENFLWKIS